MNTPLPQWKTHIYWHEKSQFLLTEDTYEDWVMFIIEQGSFHFRIGGQGELGKQVPEGKVHLEELMEIETHVELGEQDELGQFGDIIICPPYTRFQRKTITPLTFHFIVFSFLETNPTPDPSSHSTGQLTAQSSGAPSSTLSSTPSSTLSGTPSGTLLGTPSGTLLGTPSGKLSLLSFADRFSYNNSQLRKQDSLISSTVTAYREHIMLDMWFMAMQQWQSQSDTTIALPISSVMQHAASLLKQQAMSGINLKEIAAQLDLTPVQFTRQFQAAFHVTPIHFITSIRMRKACKLLTETDRTLEEIAQQCGYENGFYLSRIFQKHMNLRPSQYRKTHRL